MVSVILNKVEEMPTSCTTAGSNRFPLPIQKVSRPFQLWETLLKHFSLIGYEAGCTFPESIPIYTDNLCRLRLTEDRDQFSGTSLRKYDPLHFQQDGMCQGF